MFPSPNMIVFSDSAAMVWLEKKYLLQKLRLTTYMNVILGCQLQKLHKLDYGFRKAQQPHMETKNKQVLTSSASIPISRVRMGKPMFE